MPPFWNQRTFCVITGASRGIGKCIAVEFAKKVHPGSVLLLIARSAQALEETKSEIVSAGSPINVVNAALDLGKPNAGDYLHVINSAFITTGTSTKDFDHSILVHNAGSLGNISLKATQFDNLKELRDYYEFNLYSMILLTSQFFKVFHDSGKQRSIVQITSNGAIEPFKSWSVYCAGKAARNMFIRSLVTEDPSITALNYAPGSVDTDIFTEAESNTGDAETVQLFKDQKTTGYILTPFQTVTKLIQILEEQKFVKGEHVAYHDVP